MKFGQRPEEPGNFGAFWSILGRLVARLMKEHAHGQVILTFHEGNLMLVDVNRKYKPANLPEV